MTEATTSNSNRWLLAWTLRRGHDELVSYRPGTTLSKLGPPSSTSNIGNSTILQWGGNNSPVHLAISFGMDGRIFKRRLTRKSLINFPGNAIRSQRCGDLA